MPGSAGRSAVFRPTTPLRQLMTLLRLHPIAARAISPPHPANPDHGARGTEKCALLEQL